MTDYQKLAQSRISDSEAEKIKKFLSTENFSTRWEDYYWATKCLISLDTGESNPKLICASLNNAFRHGLSYRKEQTAYLDATRILATLYSQQGQYKLALNCLGLILELDENAPDWVYHDLVWAQNRTPHIKRNLRRPAGFLSDLAHNDKNSKETREKQIRIFREFLAGSVFYLSNNPDAEVDLAAIEAGARTYGLLGNEEWKLFLDAANGKAIHLPKTDTPIDNFEPTASNDAVTNTRPFIISLFPEDKLTENRTQVNIESTNLEPTDIRNKLEKLEKELEEKNKQLETTGNRLSEIEKEKDDLNQTLIIHQTKLANYEATIKKKNENISAIQEQLQKEKHGSAQYLELLKQLEAEQEKQKNTEADLEKTKSVHAVILADYEAAIKEKNESISAIQEQLQKEKEEAAKYHEVSKQLEYEHEKQKNTEAELEKVKSAHADVKAKLDAANEQLSQKDAENAKKNAENAALQDKVSTLEKQNSDPLSGDLKIKLKCNLTMYLEYSQKCLGTWLDRNLNNIIPNWWKICVIDVLSDKQNIELGTAHPTSFNNGFDFTKLLTIFSKNRKLLSKKFHGLIDQTYIDDMFNIRNNKWAHTDNQLPDKTEYSKALDTIYHFLDFFNCDQKILKDLADYKNLVARKNFKK